MDARENEAVDWVRCYTYNSVEEQVLYIGYGVRHGYVVEGMPTLRFVEMYDIHGTFKPRYWSFTQYRFTPTEEEIVVWLLAKLQS